MSVRAATIHEGGSLPGIRSVYSPLMKHTQVQLQVQATAIHHLVRARALGKHYSTSDKVFSRYSHNDHVIGVDGVGTMMTGPEKGQLFYFTAFETDNGSFIETVIVERKNVYPIPGELSFDEDRNVVDDEVWDMVKRVAVMANSAMASYLALGAKGFSVKEGTTVLINGVTGSSGQLAVDILQNSFGIDKIIGVGRNRNKLKPELEDKLSEFISLESFYDGDIVDVFQHYQDIEIVLDFTWGDQALRLIKTLIESRHDSSKILNWVQIGQIGGANVAIPGGLLRSNNLRIMGSGIGSFDEREGSIVFQRLVDDLAQGKIGRQVYDKIESASIDDIANQWAQWKPDSRKAFTFNKIK